MRSGFQTSLAAAAITILCGGAASDNMAVYYHVGSWDAFNGPGPDGKMVCGVGSTNPVDSRSFSLRFTIGGDTVLFEVKKPTWYIPSGTQLPVVMQIGLNAPWNVQGGGNGQLVEWTMDRDSMQTFDAQFRAASSMTLSFPTGNEPPWTVGLNGSMAISNAFGRCVTDLTQRAAAAQAPTATPLPAQGPTQPFSQAPAQPTPPAPAQPAPTQPGPTQPAPGAPPQR